MQADAEQPLKQYRKGSSPAEIIISPAMTVGNLEERFNKTYGLGVHVLRKSGKAWLETTRTNNWTLQEQNKQGEFLSNTLSK